MKLSLLVALLLILSGLGLLVWHQADDITSFLQNSQETSTSFQEKVTDQVDNLLPLAREVITPPPLRGPTTAAPTTQLTADGVLHFTNQHRSQAGVTPLLRNTTLDQAAQNKVNDMFARQYFEHESPTGEGPADVVDGVGYIYLRVGENLALGNFASDEALVQAWMDSPGHRANILSKGFTEIGIAATRGTFEGKTTWLAVQTFATPASACPFPDSALEQTIVNQNNQLTTLKQTLNSQSDTLKTRVQEIQSLYDKAAALAEEGNAKITEGNKEIKKGNEIYQETGDEEQAQPHWNKGEQLQAEGRALLEQAQAMQADADRQNEELKQQQNTYNNQVSEVNQLAETLQQNIAAYNSQIQAFNKCSASFSE